MKNLIAFSTSVFFLLSTLNLLAQDNSANSWVFLEKGTPIFITSHIAINAKKLKVGQQICLYVKVPLASQENIIIPSGTPAYFKITIIKKPKAAGEPGLMEIVPQYLKMSNGSQVALAATPVTIVGENKVEGAYAAIEAVGASSSIFYQSQAHYEKELAKSSYNLNTPMAPSGMNMNDVGQAMELLAPVAGLLVKGGHATIPKGVYLQAMVGTETPVRVN